MSKNNNTMNTVTTLKDLKEVAGLFTCLFEHKVVKTTTQFKWQGPKISEEEWHKVLAFFKWSYDTTKSEAQVRGFVNRRTGEWKFWAFPQEAKTGMSARELNDHPKFQEQRLQFNPDDGWLYFATVHHHCSTNAFQSSTDEANEKDQDGLHITVGNLAATRYSLHERFYLRGNLIPHRLEWFWDIGEVIATVPAWAAKLLPEDIEDRLARGQMCNPAPDGVGFPQEWEENIVYTPPPAQLPVHYQGGMGYSPDTGITTHTYQRKVTNLPFDLAEGYSQLQKLCDDMEIDEEHVLGEMASILENDELLVNLISLLYRNDLSLDKFAEYVEDKILDREAKATHGNPVKQIADKKEETGVPDHDGSAWDRMH